MGAQHVLSARALVRATRDHFQRAADALLRDAQGFGHNPFKIELAKCAIGRALRQAAAGEEHP